MIETEQGVQQRRERRRRRGATAMEYLFVASLIIVVLIVTIQQLGAITGALMQKNADATTDTSKP